LCNEYHIDVLVNNTPTTILVVAVVVVIVVVSNRVFFGGCPFHDWSVCRLNSLELFLGVQRNNNNNNNNNNNDAGRGGYEEIFFPTTRKKVVVARKSRLCRIDYSQGTGGQQRQQQKMDETLCLDDLLRLDDEEVEEEEVEVEDTTTAPTLDDDDDPDLWDLEQKLTIGNTTSTTASVAHVAAPAVIVAMEADESESTRSHSDAELSLSKLQQENIKLQQQMNDLQTKKSIGVNYSPPREVASVDDLLQRIHDVELETARAHHVTANLLEKIQGLEQLNQKLGAENEELKETINRNLDPVETIELGPLFVVEQNGGPQTTTNTTTTIGELKGIIENLQARIMVLVEEKLDLQLRSDRLEHELKTSPSKQQHLLPMGWFSPPPAATPRLKDNDDDDGGGGGGGDAHHGDNDHHGGGGDDDNNGGGGEQEPPQPPPHLDHPHKTTESSPSTDFLLHQGAMIEKTKRDIGNALGGIFAKVASAGDFAKNRVGNKVPTGEPTTLDQKLEVTVEDAIRDGEEKPGIPTNNSPSTVEDKTVDDGNQHHHHHQPEPTKSTLPNDGSPRHGGGWNFFGIIKKKDAVVVTPVTQQGGDEDNFMSSPTRDPPNQGLLPAMSSDSLPSMLDLSRTKLLNVFELDEDTIDFDGNNHSSDTKEKAQDQIVPLENLDLTGDDQKSDAIVTNTNNTQRTDVEDNQSLQSESKIPQGVETLP
jgi:hypothetical protein